MGRWLYPHSTLQIESTRRCNLNCPMCMRRNLSARNSLLSLENFKKALNSWDFRHVALHGWGEPLLNPEIFQMIKYAESLKVSTELTTNATLLEKNMQNIFESGLRNIVFGISNKEILPFILPQIEKFISEKNKNKLRAPKIYIDIVIYEGNFNQIPDLVEIFSKLDINGIVLHRLFNAQKVSPGIMYISFLEERELFEKILDLAKRLKVKIYFPPEPSFPCEAVKQSIFVTSEGKITPCPYLPEFYVGNLLDGGVKRAVYSEKYTNFVMNMKKHVICSRCPLGSLKEIYKILVKKEVMEM